MVYTLNDGREVAVHYEGNDIKDLDIYLTLKDGTEIDLSDVSDDEGFEICSMVYGEFQDYVCMAADDAYDAYVDALIDEEVEDE